ncbi:MAG TPA: hypothetical protein VGL65_10455 [Gemmatimonadales bacterium]|jgi:cell division protein FtsL
MQVKGRYLVLAWTAVFLAAIGVIVWRDTRGFPAQHHVDQLDNQIKALLSRQGDLQARIAALESQQELAPRVRPLGLRVALDTEIIQLPIAGGH